MTLKSIFSLNLKERQVAKQPIVAKTIQNDHWFWSSANRIKDTKAKAQSHNVKQASFIEHCFDLRGVSKTVLEDAVKQASKIRGYFHYNIKERSKETSTHWFMGAAGRMKQAKKEADSGTGFVAQQVSGVKRESFKFHTHRFSEASVRNVDNPTKFRVVLLEEGLGNSNDAFYYSKEALDSAISIFTGAKIYADHPTMEEEQIRPERSTRDILGHFENLSVETSDSGSAILCGDVDTIPSSDCDWARALMIRAVENSEKFPGKEFIGLSINAAGDSESVSIDEVISKAPKGAKPKLEEAKKNGIESVKVVRKINAAVSCDLVTEAGAGGKILNIIQGENQR